MCSMRPCQKLMPVDDAMAILMAEIRPIEETETVSLISAGGRVLAEDIASPIDVPPFDRAAMDGYAVVSASTASACDGAPVVLRCVERIHAGSIAQRKVTAQTCIEIATGAALPTGADAVVMVEQTRTDGDRVELLRSVRRGQHITGRGADMARGESVLTAGTYLTPARVGAIAAVGRGEVVVYRRPRVSIGATGNEVVEPGQTLRPGQIYNINSYSLAALFESLGCEVDMLPVAQDDLEVIKQRILSALDADLVVMSGGSSVGEKDLLQDAFAALGAILFHGIAIKPGKPTMLARIQGKPVVGMPGYPTSCLSNGYLFLAPAVDKLARRPDSRRPRVSARLVDPIVSMADKFQLYTVRLENGHAAAAFKESGVITSMSRADGFVAIPVGVERLEPGEDVEVTLL
jgi:molybdopterin molybdotransferase